MGGVLTLDWRMYTLKVLWIMFQAKIQDDYDHTSRIMMMLGTKKPAAHYHPFRRETDSKDRRSVRSNNIYDLTHFIT